MWEDGTAHNRDEDDSRRRKFLEKKFFLNIFFDVHHFESLY